MSVTSYNHEMELDAGGFTLEAMIGTGVIAVVALSVFGWVGYSIMARGADTADCLENGGSTTSLLNANKKCTNTRTTAKEASKAADARLTEAKE